MNEEGILIVGVIGAYLFDAIERFAKSVHFIETPGEVELESWFERIQIHRGLNCDSAASSMSLRRSATPR